MISVNDDVDLKLFHFRKLFNLICSLYRRWKEIEDPGILGRSSWSVEAGWKPARQRTRERPWISSGRNETTERKSVPTDTAARATNIGESNSTFLNKMAAQNGGTKWRHKMAALSVQLSEQILTKNR